MSSWTRSRPCYDSFSDVNSMRLTVASVSEYSYARCVYYSRLNLGIGSVVNEGVFHSHVLVGSRCTIGECAGNGGRKDCVGLGSRFKSFGRCVRIDVFKKKQAVLDGLEVIEYLAKCFVVDVDPVF